MVLPSRNLDAIIGKERFAAEPDADKLVELEALRDFLSTMCEAIDAMVDKTGGAKERYCYLYKLGELEGFWETNMKVTLDGYT